MKKFTLSLCMIVLAAFLAIGTFAAETVIYENDFSDPATLEDFEQYCQKWEIKNGGLYLTENFFSDAEVKKVESSYAHIIYQADEKLTDYIVEVDYMNIQTSGGIIFRAQQDEVDHQVSGFYGYTSFMANDATKGALGSCADTGKYKGNIHVGKGGNANISSNVHIKVTVKGEKIHTLITNIDNGKTVYEYTYTIGTNLADQIWTEGTAGLRMRAAYVNNDAYSADNAYFDNFKITTANEVDLGSTGIIPDAPTVKLPIDTSNLVPVYENKFEKATDLNDFEQFQGTWSVFSGKLYLSAASGNQSYILYCGKDELLNLTDYVIDVDMYNIQTQGGPIIRSDFANVKGESVNGFMGYQAFVSNTGTQGALGAGKPDGNWLEGNIEVSPVCLNPGMNLHLQFAVKGKMLQFVITNLDTGKVLWQWSEEHDLWSKGTFGFRLRGNSTSAGLNNLNNTAFDNLVVSTYGEAKEQTVVKMTIGKGVGYINGVEKALDAAPIIRESRTMLPVRFVAEAFGATVGWDGATSTATVKTSDVEIKITIGAKEAVVNGKTVALDAPAFIENSRTYMPVRFVAENLGATVAWDGTTSTATLTK